MTPARLWQLFNRLEAAISHHKAAHDRGDAFADEADDALWHARDRVLLDACRGDRPGEYWSRIEHLAGPKVPSEDFAGCLA